MAERTIAASDTLVREAPLYGVIFADPPWRFEPYSRITGMDHAADNHYATMTTDEIKALPVPAAPDCVLFLCARRRCCRGTRCDGGVGLHLSYAPCLGEGPHRHRLGQLAVGASGFRKWARCSRSNPGGGFRSAAQTALRRSPCYVRVNDGPQQPLPHTGRPFWSAHRGPLR